MQILGSYVIRKEAGEAVEGSRGNSTSASASHAAFLGYPSARPRSKLSHMSRYTDPRAPTGLTSDEMDALKADPAIVQLRELRDRLPSEVHISERRRGASFRKDGHNQLGKKSRSTAVFDTISTTEINKQLDLSMLDLEDSDWVPERVEHRLEERQLVTALICLDTCEFGDQDKISHSIGTANALVASYQKDTPLRLRPDLPPGLQNKTESSGHQPFPQAPTTMQCVFCFWNTRKPYEVRLRDFSTVYKTRDHVELHLNQFKENDDITCPAADCQVSVAGHAGNNVRIPGLVFAFVP
ncbi:hypothetical protein DV736_g326, partial [Chaetothyriales sp. CBS 134916]